MIVDKVSSWWRSVPQKTRVKLIVMMLLLFAGTEMIVLAPYILDIAVMIDVGGLIFVLAAIRASVSLSAMQLRESMAMMAKPLFAVSRTVEKVVDFGLDLPPKWYHRWLLVGRIAARCRNTALPIIFIGFIDMKALVAIRRVWF